MPEKIAIYFKDNNSRTRENVDRLVDEFSKRGKKTRVYQKMGDISSGCTWQVIDISPLTFNSGLPDLVLSVGGDGTFLETVLNVRNTGTPIAGVNTGRMGFLANISTDEISRSVEMLCNNEFDLIERSLLELSEPADLFDGMSLALNEITIQKADLSMITINVFIDDTHLNTYWADGLIVSTATGSTAYNLSVGGPILSPGDESIIISPIAPHNLTIRPIILSGTGKIRMVIEGRSREYLATCDFRSKRLPFSQEIIIVKSAVKVKTVMLKGRDFYTTLRNKLMWGADSRN
jgi:NAD+ kinase